MGKLKVLTFDIENRPLSYWIPDRPTAEITAIAAGWEGESSVKCWLLGEVEPEEILQEFVKLYDEADLVTGHYIRAHDLPIINGGLIEAGMDCLNDKMTCDTKLDMVKKADIPATQEFLSETFGVPFDKEHMTQTAWRRANRLGPEGLKLTKKRVVGDVKQHQALRAEMVRRNLLNPPKIWRP